MLRATASALPALVLVGCLRMGYSGGDASSEARDLAALDRPNDSLPLDRPGPRSDEGFDGKQPDLPGTDATPDAAKLDAAKPDAAKLDGAKPDAAKLDGAKPDAAKPDLKPDASKLDTAKPDSAKPDAAKPDTKPDLAKPDLQIVPGTWVTILKGTFVMGSPTNEPCNSPGETQHQVTLTHDFELSTTEVLRSDFSKLMGYDPTSYVGCTTSCPVDNVSWAEAAQYCNALSQLKALPLCYACTGSQTSASCGNASGFADGAIYSCPGYRLPTEAEWEYAYRAGTTTGLYNGEITSNCNGTDSKADAIAWYSDSTTHPVGLKQPNAWGLYDMAGNAWEWTHDLSVNNLGSGAVTDPWGATSSNGRVYRGGSVAYGLRYIRAAYRASYLGRFIAAGFRCARTK